MLGREIVDTIIGGVVCDAQKDWSSLATRLGIPKREILDKVNKVFELFGSECGPVPMKREGDELWNFK